MPKAIFQIILGAMLVSGCAATAVRSDALSPSQLNANPARYDGKTVVVRGFVKLAPEGHVLYESEALDAEFKKGWDSGNNNFDPRKYEKYCLTIANPELLYKNQSAVNGKTLVMTGKFIAHYLDGRIMDLGACPLPTAITIDESDLKQRYKTLLKEK